VHPFAPHLAASCTHLLSWAASCTPLLPSGRPAAPIWLSRVPRQQMGAAKTASGCKWVQTSAPTCTHLHPLDSQLHPFAGLLTRPWQQAAPICCQDSKLHPFCCQDGKLHPLWRLADTAVAASCTLLLSRVDSKWIQLPSWIHLLATLDSKWVQLAVLGAPAPRMEGPRILYRILGPSIRLRDGDLMHSGGRVLRKKRAALRAEGKLGKCWPRVRGPKKADFGGPFLPARGSFF